MNTTSSLTKKQAEILAFIKDFHRENNYAPSYREIAAHLGISSPATVCEHVKNLERKGHLSNLGGARSLETEQEVEQPAAVILPLKGLITAGEPIEAIESPESITVPESMVRRPEMSYVLRVMGESMIEDGILSGDYVVVEANPSPRDGEIVVALIDGEAVTLKRLYREPGRIRLQPANRTMKPFYVKNVAVQGVVRGLFRQYSAA